MRGRGSLLTVAAVATIAATVALAAPALAVVPASTHTISGRVLCQGSPVANEDYSLWTTSGKPLFPTPDTTDAQGRYSISNVKPGTYQLRAGRISVYPGDGIERCAAVSRTVTVGSASKHLDLVEPPAAIATGTFTLPAAADDAFWYLKRASVMSRSKLGLGSVVQSSIGNVVASGLPAGTYVIELAAEHDGRVIGYGVRTFTVKTGQRLALGTLTATRAPLTLSGRAPRGSTLSFDPLPLADVHVGASGRYSVGGLVPGTYTVTVRKPGYASRTFTAAVREPVLNVGLGAKLH